MLRRDFEASGLPLRSRECLVMHAALLPASRAGFQTVRICTICILSHPDQCEQPRMQEI